MIDFRFEIKSVQPINLANVDTSQHKISYNIRKSIVLYNTSIMKIRGNDLDSAISDLKRALFYNRGFVEAKKLLGLCYVNKKNYKLAEKAFIKLAECEIYSDLAKIYLKNSIIERTMAEAMNDVDRVNSGLADKKQPNILYSQLNKKIIISSSIIIVAVLCLIINQQLTSNPQNVLGKMGAIGKSADSEKSKILIEDNTLLYENYKNIEKELHATKSELERYKNKYNMILVLNEIEKAISDRDYEHAAVSLLAIKNMNLDDETKVTIDKLLAEIKAKAVWTIYNHGNKLYKAKKYEAAIPKLKIALELEPNPKLLPWIAYQIGISYKEINDKDNALIFFQKVKDNYPKSKYALYSEKMIKEIQ